MWMPITGTAGPVASGVPPTSVEQALFEAKSRGDWDGYIRVLLGADTFSYAVKESVDREAGRIFYPHYHGRDGRQYLAIHTRGELLPRRPDIVACPAPLPLEPGEWGNGVHGLLVNPDTPTEAYFPDARYQQDHWRRLRKGVPERGHDDDMLVTKYTGPLHGPLAHGLACGTHLAVHNQVLWNDVGDVYRSYPGDREILSDSWGVTDRQGWLRQLGYLLQGRNSPEEPEFALRVRREIARRQPGAHTDPQLWRRVAADNLQRYGAEPGEIAAVLDLIGKIVRYEARFRADGLLPPDGYVTSALATTTAAR